ncbi:MAG TPA: 16S rRNA (guanine(527)-N(7))-methyltransferase RsmG [Acidimicrobiales bacterium]|nr:16S rRNA (guanine(527)-N(7))-methyltransferase RsmG [Acidimicrobiales bacterium]
MTEAGQQRLLTVPPAPPTATEVFGAALDKARDFAALLATEGVTRGLIGPRETPRLWDRHLLNCAVVAELLPPAGQLVDIGSGAGLPGIVLALVRPQLEVILLEPMLRRVSFLQECVESLGMANTSVVRGRAEELSGKLRADVVTARAVAPLDKLAGWATGLLGPDGVILAIKGQSAEEELVAAQPVLKRLGARRAEIRHVGQDKVLPETTVVRVVMSGRGREEQARAHRRRPGMA